MAAKFSDQSSDLLAVATDAAREAAELLMRLRRAGDVAVTRTKSSATDIVTTADAAAEQLLRSRLFDARPGDGWLGEETGPAAGRQAGSAATPTVRWIVDPLDGTVNYLYDLPGWAVSVAAEVDGHVVAGCVVVPSVGEVFTAALGGGAWCNGQEVAASECDDLASALVATGFSYDADVRARQGAQVAQVLPHVRDIRRFGAAAADFCAVAVGRVDAFYEYGLQPWDRAAGALIAREAGAVVDEAADGSVLAAGPLLFAPMQQLLVDPDVSVSSYRGQSS